MSKMLSDGTYLIQPEPPGQCAFCGTWAELRPVGPNDERICVSCGAKDPETTKRKMGEYIQKARRVAVDRRGSSQ